MDKRIDVALVKSMRDFMSTQNIGSEFLADAIVRQQIVDIPEHTQRSHFGESGSIRELENNSKKIRRWLNFEVFLPLRIVPTILRVIGLFPKPGKPGISAFEHLNTTSKEHIEVIAAYLKAIEDKDVTPAEAAKVWQEGMEAIIALFGMMLDAQEKASGETEYEADTREQ